MSISNWFYSSQRSLKWTNNLLQCFCVLHDRSVFHQCLHVYQCENMNVMQSPLTQHFLQTHLHIILYVYQVVLDKRLPGQKTSQNLIISIRPSLITAALVLSPQPSPSAKPAPTATIFQCQVKIALHFNSFFQLYKHVKYSFITNLLNLRSN